MTDFENTTIEYLQTIDSTSYDSKIILNAINDNIKSFSFLTCTFIISIFFYLFFHNLTNRRDV